MKMRFSILIAIFTFGIIDSCSKSPACWGGDENLGIIAEYYSVHEFPMCIENYVNNNENLIIKTAEELFSITDSNCYNLPEAGYSSYPPDIDFNEYTLLGFWTTGQCDTKFIREVLNNETNKRCTYKIIVKECGTCKSLRYDANLVLVPKIPDDFSVDFILEDRN